MKELETFGIDFLWWKSISVFFDSWFSCLTRETEYVDLAFTSLVFFYTVKVMVKKFLYRPAQTLRVPLG